MILFHTIHCCSLSHVGEQLSSFSQTETTIDTLDYSGSGLNQGSKVVIAVAGPLRQKLATEIPAGLELPSGFGPVALCQLGILAIEGPQSGQGKS